MENQVPLTRLKQNSEIMKLYMSCIVIYQMDVTTTFLNGQFEIVNILGDSATRFRKKNECL